MFLDDYKIFRETAFEELDNLMKNEHSVKTTRQALEIMYQPNHGLLINKNENGNQNNCHDNNCNDNNCGINNCHDKNCDNISFHGNFHSNGNGYRNVNTHRNAKENRINENENSMENNNDQYDNFFIYNDDKEDESCFTLQNKNQISCKNEPIAIINKNDKNDYCNKNDYLYHNNHGNNNDDCKDENDNEIENENESGYCCGHESYDDYDHNQMIHCAEHNNLNNTYYHDNKYNKNDSKYDSNNDDDNMITDLFGAKRTQNNSCFNTQNNHNNYHNNINTNINYGDHIQKLNNDDSNNSLPTIQIPMSINIQGINQIAKFDIKKRDNDKEKEEKEKLEVLYEDVPLIHPLAYICA